MAELNWSSILKQFQDYSPSAPRAIGWSFLFLRGQPSNGLMPLFFHYLPYDVQYLSTNIYKIIDKASLNEEKTAKLQYARK